MLKNEYRGPNGLTKLAKKFDSNPEDVYKKMKKTLNPKVFLTLEWPEPDKLQEPNELIKKHHEQIDQEKFFKKHYDSEINFNTLLDIYLLVREEPDNFIKEYRGQEGQIKFGNQYLKGDKNKAYKVVKNLLDSIQFPALGWEHPDTNEIIVGNPKDTIHFKTAPQFQTNPKSNKEGIGTPIPNSILKVSESRTIAPPSLVTKKYAEALNGPIGLKYSEEQGFNLFAEEHFYSDPQQAIKHLIPVLEPQRWKELGWKKIYNNYIRQNSLPMPKIK